MPDHIIHFKNSYVWILCLLLCGCVDPVALKLPDDVKYLVVQGLITDEPGPYTVRISMTTPYGRPTGRKDIELQGASVLISDERGQQEILSEVKAGADTIGVYKTSAVGIRGRVGGVYTLHIQLKDGRVYSSRPETLVAGTEIENVELDFERQPVYEAGNEPISNNRYAVNVTTKDPSSVSNYYRWEWESVYEVSTQPWNHEYWPPLGNGPVPDPKACCQTCWVYDTLNLMEVGEDRLVNGNTFRKQVGILPLTSEVINVRARVEVVQFSVSPEAYDYWRVFVAQSRITGSVLDPPPANPRGNVFNTANADEPVFGYFGASSVSRKAVFINREDVPEVPPLLEYPDDCRTLDYSTAIRPSFW